MTRQRVVVTGLGAVSPLGMNTGELWQGLAAGRSGIKFISSFDPTYFPVKVAGEVTGFPYDPASKLPRTYQLLRLAAQEAAGQSNLDDLPADSRCGVFTGRSIDWPTPGELVAAYSKEIGQSGATPRLSPEQFASYRFGAGSPLLGQILGLSGRLEVTQVLDGACATGGMVVGEAFRHIRAGQVDLAVAAASSSWTNLAGITAYHNLKALSTEATNPGQASRPFDIRRSGFVMAEGAAVLVLESLEHALRRGRQPLAEVTGYGMTTSAYRITDLPPEGLPQYQAMDRALADAGRQPEEVDYINAHGTSTYQNDLVETRAIHRLLGRRSHLVPVSSNKSMTGHTITTAGALEAIATVFTLNQRLIPPTINQSEPDPECDLDYVPNIARQQDVRVALSNSFGFGGQNCALVLETYH